VRLYLRFLKRRGEILPPREAILKALMRTYLKMAFASQEVPTIASRWQEKAEKHSRIHWYRIHGQRGQYDRNMNGEPRNKHVRT
jgi:hypothetical protein